MTSQAHVVVIGGGATGAGVAHDLALRGLRVTLLERGELTSGTTGRHHELLHSGGWHALDELGDLFSIVTVCVVVRWLAALASNGTPPSTVIGTLPTAGR